MGSIDEEKGKARMSHFCQAAMEKEPYGNSFEIDGTFKDYLEVVLLICHITFCSAVFPLAPALGFVLLLVEIRVDGFKLFELVRRPLPVSAENIGNWIFVLQTISWLSLFSNAGLLAFTLGSFDNLGLSDYQLPNWVFCLFFAVALSALKLGLSILIPDLPDSVRIAEEHQAWIRQEVDIAASGDDSDTAWRYLGRANVLTLDLP